MEHRPLFVPGLPEGPIYRYLGELVYARDFQMGRIRISTLRRCRTNEDTARRDAREGNRAGDSRNVLVVGKGLEITIDIHTDVRVEHAFVLCFTERNDSFIRDRFGPYGVEVSEPGRLFADLTKAISARGFRVFAPIASRVYYRERAFVGNDPPFIRTELLKPPFPFEEEREVRFVWRLTADPGVESVDLVLPDAPQGCRVLDE